MVFYVGLRASVWSRVFSTNNNGDGKVCVCVWSSASIATHRPGPCGPTAAPAREPVFLTRVDSADRGQAQGGSLMDE